jgi:hypothetical protein
MQIKFNKESKIYKFDETVIINLQGSKDPQDPGTQLEYFWDCPQQTLEKAFCPSGSQ